MDDDKKCKEHGTIHCLPGSGRCFQLTPEVLAIIEERMQEDDETTASQLVRILNAQGYTVSKPTIVRARKILGWTFHGSRYCQMIRNNNKEKRVEWARENLNNTFENVVWTDESMIQLENHRTFLVQEGWRSSKTEGAGETSLQGHSVGRDIEERSNKDVTAEWICQQRCIPRSTAYPPVTSFSGAVTRRQVAARQRSMPHLQVYTEVPQRQ